MQQKPQTALKRGQIERELVATGRVLAGVDEVGRGCIAGPVVAACAILDYDAVASMPESEKALLRDSKTLSAAQRRMMVPIIHRLSRECHTAFASVEEIEKLGIVQATFLAMRRAIDQLNTPFDLLLVDGKQPLGNYEGEQLPVVKGDNLCFAIAAAAIVAKEERDQYMHQQSELFPNYGFENHVGYGTKQHLSMIEKHGVCQLHRRNFEPIRSLVHAVP